jgi:hypothetical protein
MYVCQFGSLSIPMNIHVTAFKSIEVFMYAYILTRKGIPARIFYISWSYTPKEVSQSLRVLAYTYSPQKIMPNLNEIF